MKKNILYFWITFLSITLYSCDTDVTPTDAVEGSLVIENVDNAEKVLNGTWRYLWDTYTTYRNPGWNALLLASDAMGDDVAVQPGKYGYLAQYSYTETVNTSSSFLRHIWLLGYKSIDNMNIILSEIDNMPGNDTQRKRVKAQAEAIRGYIYLNYATFYGGAYINDSTALCVPIYTEPSVLGTPGKSKSTLSEVYKQAENDLLNAYENIGNYSNGGLKYKITKPIISGLLARIYLQTNRWAKAQKYAAEAHANFEWMAKSEYAKGFNDYNNSEWIWGHGQTTDQDVASYSFHYKDVSSSSSYYYSFMADPYFKDYFKDYDIRTDLFEYDTKRFLGGLMYKKFLFRSNMTGDIVIMRKAEQVLIEAEAFAELGNLSAAISKLNELREARLKDGQDISVLPDLSNLTKDELIEEILLERRKELFGEGFALSDIIRRQKSLVRKAVATNTYLTVDGSPVIINDAQVTIKGHTVTKFPDGTSFVANSTYYKFVIGVDEQTNNPNL